MPVHESILDLIGNTPMVDVSALSPNPEVRIVAKLEGQNPGGSVKDRAAFGMIQEAEKDGSLQPGATILAAFAQSTSITPLTVRCGDEEDRARRSWRWPRAWSRGACDWRSTSH